MPTVNLGRVRPIHKGTYSAATAYVPLDMVTYLGSTYFCIQNSTGVTPAVGVYWQLIAATGLQPSNNLSDVDSVPTARTNLGLSTVSAPNLAHNPIGTVNQRGYVSGTATTAANQFTLDRWFVLVSGQNLTFTGDDSYRIMTAPAGGVGQVRLGRNIRGGTYVMNWVGTATLTVNGTARAKGEAFTLTANTNAKIVFYSGTFTEVKWELGTVSTAFAMPDYEIELKKCAYYWRKLGGTGLYDIFAQGAASVGSAIGLTLTFPEMVRAPTAAKIGTWVTGNCAQPNIVRASATTVSMNAVGTSGTFAESYFASNATSYITLDAERTS